MESPDALSTKALSLTIHDGVAIIKIDIRGVKENTFTSSVATEFKILAVEIATNDEITAVVFMSGKPGSFVAGADINMLSEVTSAADGEAIARDAQAAFSAIENSSKPVVAAIMGTCMGAGVELSLACHYRIAVNDSKTQFALPEVMIGLLPGAGGTQRLPQLVGITNALDLILTGKSIRPLKAREMGLIDLLVDPAEDEVNSLIQLENKAITVARDLADGLLIAERTRPLFESIFNYVLACRPFIDYVVLRTARNKLLSLTKNNYPGPLRILDVVRTGIITGGDFGYEEEARAFGELTQTPVCKALINVFHATTNCKKNMIAYTMNTENLIVIGATPIGTGIASISIGKNISTTLIDSDCTELDRSLKLITGHYDTRVERNQITQTERDDVLSRFFVTTALDKLAQATRIVVDSSSTEDIFLKVNALSTIEINKIADGCALGTIVSPSLNIGALAAESLHPERIVGLHYFDPVEKSKLLEVACSNYTSQEALAAAVQLGLDQKKFVVAVKKESPGFFVTRALVPLLDEAIRLLAEGVTPRDLDDLTTQLGFTVGLATLIDQIGVNVISTIGEKLENRIGAVQKEIINDLVRAGQFGVVNSAGIYQYISENSEPTEVNEFFTNLLEKHSIPPSVGTSSPEDQKLRLFCRFINEAVLCLQEGVISSTSEGDVASIFGAGFPPFLGGPFFFVDTYGAKNLVKDMERFAVVYGREQFTPCALLLDHASNDTKFYAKN